MGCAADAAGGRQYHRQQRRRRRRHQGLLRLAELLGCAVESRWVRQRLLAGNSSRYLQNVCPGWNSTPPSASYGLFAVVCCDSPRCTLVKHCMHLLVFCQLRCKGLHNSTIPEFTVSQDTQNVRVNLVCGQQGLTSRGRFRTPARQPGCCRYPCNLLVQERMAAEWVVLGIQE